MCAAAVHPYFGLDSARFTKTHLLHRCAKDAIDERAREFHWEGKRRTDLVRFDLFTTGTYLWPWKGNAANGRAVESHRNLYPIPTPELNTNPNLVQNDGYN